MAELTPWTEVSASWMSVWGDEDDISIKNEEFDVQNGTNNGNITFDIESDLINASANIDKESNCSSTNATFVDICHGLDLDVTHLAQEHVINNVTREEIVHTTIADTPSSSAMQLIDQDHILNNHQEIKVMTEQELATEYLMNSVNLMKSKHHPNTQHHHQINENLIMDMPLDAMYSSTSNLSSTDVDQIVEEKIEINANDLIMGVDLDGHHHHHAHDLNQLINQSTQQCLNDLTNTQNGGTTLSDSFKNRLHYVKYINRDGKHVKIWECGVCNKEFGHQYTLMRHLPTHTDERKFQCNTCGKAFRQMSTLSQHRAIHSADRPYVCELCRKTFNRVSTLISHRKTHSGLKPHQCHLCHKAFHQKGNLRNHIFTHTNERPYKCDVCQKGFNQMSNLMCHKLKAHQRNDKPKYMCRLCNKEFPKRMALRNHEEYKHGIKNQQQTSTTASTSATSLSALSTSSLQTNTNDLLLQQSALNSINTTNNPLLMNGGGASSGGVNGGGVQIGSGGDINSNDHLGQDKMRIIHIPDIGGSIQSMPTQSSTKVRYTNGVLVDAINTEAMRQALQAQQANGTSSLPSSAPFALLRPIGGIPVLVRVLSAPHGKHMLVPATAEDLKAHGKITISDNGNGTGIHLSDNNDSSKNSNTTTTVQIKIPVVATVVQKFEPDGTMSMSVESPGPDNRQLIQDSINNAVDNHLNNTNNSNLNDSDDNNMEFLKESCDNMSISLPNSSGYMSFHADTSPYTTTTTTTSDIQDLDTSNVSVVASLKDDLTNSTFDSIDLSVDNTTTSTLNNNNNNNYNYYNNEHHLLATESQLRHYNNQFHSYQIIEQDLNDPKTNDQHFNITSTNNNNNNNNELITDNTLILNEHSLYNDVNQHFTFITNNNNNNINTTNQTTNIIVDNDDDKFDIL